MENIIEIELINENAHRLLQDLEDMKIIRVLSEKQKNTKSKTINDFAGILSDNEYQSLKAHTEQARKEWNRNI